MIQLMKAKEHTKPIDGWTSQGRVKCFKYWNAIGILRSSYAKNAFPDFIKMHSHGIHQGMHMAADWRSTKCDLKRIKHVIHTDHAHRTCGPVGCSVCSHERRHCMAIPNLPYCMSNRCSNTEGMRLGWGLDWRFGGFATRVKACIHVCRYHRFQSWVPAKMLGPVTCSVNSNPVLCSNIPGILSMYPVWV